MKFYVTTPIYYVNDLPHIGHAYTSIAADVLARFNRMRGRRVFFLTGTDEHGQKVQQAAGARGLSPREHADLMVDNFRGLWQRLGLTNDAFIRTTDDGHKDVVRELLMDLWERGEIQKRSYRGWYCTPDERFWTGKDLVEGKCPECGRDVEEIEEENYFFLMSKYQGPLIAHIEANPTYILPETRRNEVLGFLRTQPLGDLCISRPVSRLSWGIPLPFDEGYVTYVWFDALLNYFSATRYLSPDADVQWWPAEHHIIGKDILTTHAVYWSAMLMALKMPLPGNIFAHGWWTIEGRKMSKSLGNVVDPGAVAGQYGNDAFRYFLMREVPFGLDGDYSEEALIRRINTDLANDLGNLASRVLKMAAQYFQSVVPEPEGEPIYFARTGAVQSGDPLSINIRTGIAEGILAGMEEALQGLQFHHALDEIWKLVSIMNKYIDAEAPWVLAKDSTKRGHLGTVIYSSLEALRVLCLYLHPFMPDATARLYAALGLETSPASVDLEEGTRWGGLVPGTRTAGLDALFPRIDKTDKNAKKKAAMQEEAAKDETPAASVPEAPGKAAEEAPAQEALIGIEEFARVELRTALVVHAERVKGSKKLLRLEVDAPGRRQVIAGIGKAYAPEDLIGKTVVIVANLKPARLMGLESNGMVLAATAEGGEPVILTPEGGAPPGLRIK